MVARNTMFVHQGMYNQYSNHHLDDAEECPKLPYRKQRLTIHGQKCVRYTYDPEVVTESVYSNRHWDDEEVRPKLVP